MMLESLRPQRLQRGVVIRVAVATRTHGAGPMAMDAVGDQGAAPMVVDSAAPRVGVGAMKARSDTSGARPSPLPLQPQAREEEAAAAASAAAPRARSREEEPEARA